MSKETTLSEKIWEKSSDWVDNIGDVIGKMAEKLGVATEHVYEVYTRQVFYEGLTKTAICGSVLLIMFLINIYIWAVTRKMSMESESKWIPRLIGFVLFVLIGGILTSELLVPNILKMVNPEYYTIKEIVDMVKGVVGNE